MKVSEANRTLRRAIQDDVELAWLWHSSFVVPMQDEGMEKIPSHRAAATIMLNLFDVDMNKHKNYIEIMNMEAAKEFQELFKYNLCGRSEK